MLATFKTIDVLERFRLLERGQVGGDAVDGVAGRLLRPGGAPVGELGDGSAGPEMRSGADPGGGGGQLVLAGGEPAGFKNAGRDTEFLGRFGERSCPDVVAADDEISRGREAASRRKPAAR